VTKWIKGKINKQKGKTRNEVQVFNWINHIGVNITCFMLLNFEPGLWSKFHGAVQFSTGSGLISTSLVSIFNVEKWPPGSIFNPVQITSLHRSFGGDRINRRHVSQ
jgi:hypothetical protein